MLVFKSDRVANVLYSGSLFFLIFFTAGFLIVTPADTIHQAAKNNQIYNVIIIAAVYFAVALVAIVLYANRLYDVRLSLSEIPKGYMLSEIDVPKNCDRVINSELTRCGMIKVETQPDENVSHPGLPPPKHSNFDFPQVPYLEVILESVKVIEAKVVNLHPSLARQPGMTLRDYLAFLEDRVLLDTEMAARFVDEYEHARFSDRPLHEDQFKSILRVFTLLIRSFDLPDDDAVSLAGSDARDDRISI
ncbi:uncharacterized protein V1510DRAFT_423277 [Dipodascopsis tothii]|uniref:uncharacterized protein n=1 Tax=Dipodascopsis tothii TaxID=44089 RepID=UPI0034CDCBDC